MDQMNRSKLGVFKAGQTIMTLTRLPIYGASSDLKLNAPPLSVVSIGHQLMFISMSCEYVLYWQSWRALYQGQLCKVLLNNDDIKRGCIKII